MLVNTVQRYMVLGLIFIGISLTAYLVLERIEGYQITTTEYYGLRNAGGVIYILSLILGFGHYLLAFFIVILSPIAWLLRKYVRFPMVRTFIYMVGFGCGGLWVFDQMYSPYFVNGYDLNRITSIWIFAIAGVVYAIMENKIWRRGQMQKEQKAT
ncbi:hypothetical protein HF638_05095 [Paenibacillus sp. SZ31]|uniref:hypothetical protein n=1 Tax=Paenibacillus sp. SZ31 TaxID=2725555 RepID=UPI00146E68AA|nr:hypothetical protein [Paenibacillus sp. SZ31]NMI03339.1 hypothetical protein [Paenibacillus sp. SZ31]